jgi:hypothetical protein
MNFLENNDNKKYKLTVLFPDNSIDELGTYNSEKEAIDKIKRELARLEIEWYYFRILQLKADKIKIDYGSHTTFYEIELV